MRNMSILDANRQAVLNILVSNASSISWNSGNQAFTGGRQVAVGLAEKRRFPSDPGQLKSAVDCVPSQLSSFLKV